MTKKSLMSTLKWIFGDILVPLVVGISAVYVAVQANRISELQAMIAKGSEQPTFEVAQLHCPQDEYCPQEERIEISVLDGKYSNYRSNIRTFLVCNFYHDDGTIWTPLLLDVELPMTAYYSRRENSNSLYGNIETWHSEDGYEKVRKLCSEVAHYYDNATANDTYTVKFTDNVRTFLEITYTDLLGETEAVYYLIEPHANRPVVRIDAEYGVQQLKKFEEMMADGQSISPLSSRDDILALLPADLEHAASTQEK